MNKKGFTLTEILAVLVILGVVMVIAIPSVTNLQDRFKAKYYEKLDDTVISASKTYFKDNKSAVPKQEVGAVALNLNGLITKKYLESVYPYNNNTDQCKGYVVLVKNGTDNQYYNCMYCNVDGQTVYESSSRKNTSTKNMCLLLGSEQSFTAENDTVQIPAKAVGTNNDVVYIYYGADPNYLKNNLAISSMVQLMDPKTEEVLSTVKVSDALYPEEITNVTKNVLPGKTVCTSGNTATTCNSIYDPKLKYADGNERSYFLYKYSAPIVYGAVGNQIEVGTTIVKLLPSLMKFVDKKDATTNVEIGTFPKKDREADDPIWFKEFQYTTDGGYSWKNFCDTYECSRKFETGVSNGDKIKFRMVIEDKSGIHYSDETNDYTVKSQVPSTVSFVTNCGSIAGTRTYTTTSAYGTLPTVTLIPGYTWVGWFDGNTKVGPTDTPSGENVTLEGRCTAQAYSVSFNANGGTVTPTSKTVTYDQKYGGLPTPTYTKHTFKGWYTSASGGTKVTENTIVKTASNHTIYAHWEADPDKITLDANGGTIGGKTTNDINVYDGAAMSNISRPYRSGYEFIGWFGSKSNADDPLGWYASKHTELSGADYRTIYNDMLQKSTNDRSEYTASSIYKKGTTPSTLYAGWYMSTQEITYSCRQINLSAGIYYVEIVGGGAGGKGCEFSSLGGHAARWAGYLNIPTGTYDFCPGNGSAEVYGCGSSYPSNGGDSYIGTSASNYIIKADGGKSAKNKPYSGSTVHFGTSNPVKKECKNVSGKEDHGLLSTFAPVYNIYGFGGGVEPGRFKHGYNGTAGVIFISFVSSSPSSWSAPSSCPATICPNEASGNLKGCRWSS